MKRVLSTLYLSEIKKLSSEMKIMFFYRYFSLILTSIFYLTRRPGPPVTFKLVVVGCLIIAALILNYLYLKHENISIVTKLLVIIETIGNVIILIPSGGLNSPYIWYSLNTVLITACFLSTFYFWFNLITYTAFLTLVSFFYFDKFSNGIVVFILRNSNHLLSYILIIFAIKLLMQLTKKLHNEREKLSVANKELIQANSITKESIEHINSLYKSINNFTNIKNKNGLIQTIVEHMEIMTKAPLAFSCICSEKEQFILKVSKQIPATFQKILFDSIKQHWVSVIKSDIFRLFINNKEIMIVPIKSYHEVYGFLGIQIKNENKGIVEKENVHQIKVLASLSAIIFERLKMEEINYNLIIAEEQNRIANEIHDSVSQRLFSISCKVPTLIEMHNNRDSTNLNSELNFIRNSLNITMKELRETIYSLSDNKNESSVFENNIKNYINEVARLNEVTISYEIMGSLELISYDLKKVIYRIICEGIGNAIRHGKSQDLKIDLSVEKDCIKLVIVDNGKGFDLKSTLSSNKGLGIKNIHNLVYSFGGEIVFNSQLCKGTSINVIFPNLNLKNINKEKRYEVSYCG